MNWGLSARGDLNGEWRERTYARWDTEENGFIDAVPESSNHQSRELFMKAVSAIYFRHCASTHENTTHICLERIGHIVEEDRSNQHPNFQILKGFENLVLLVVSILHASLIRLETFDSNDPFTLSKELGCVRRIWKDPPECASEADRYETKLHIY